MSKEEEEFKKARRYWFAFLVVLVVGCFSFVAWSQMDRARADAKLTQQCIEMGFQNGYRINGHTFACLDDQGRVYLPTYQGDL